MGTENLLMAMIDEPELVQDMFGTYLDRCMQLFQRIWDAGYRFDEVHWPDDMGYKGTTFFSPATYRQMVQPFHKAAVDWAHSKGIYARLHSCGNIMSLVPDIVATGMDALNPLEVKAGMDPLQLLPILIQTARGLFVAHSHGVVHRDVKPANIMVSDNGDVKITDFGVSYSTNQEQITQDGMVVGTAQYISPEQAQGEQATPRSDIYSLGVVAYEGVAGHRPFTGATPVDIAAAHVNDTVPPLPDSVDFQLREFIMSMLAKDPRDRPADALVVSRTLARIERRLLDQQTELNEATIVSGRMPRRISSTPHLSFTPPVSFTHNHWKEQQ